MQLIKESLIVLAVGCFVAFPALAQETATSESEPATDTEAVHANTVVASVNGTEITLGHVITLRNRLPDEYKEIDDAVLLPGLVDQLVQQTLLAGLVDPKSLRVQLAAENEYTALLAGEAIEEIYTEASTEEKLAASYQERHVEGDPDFEYHAAHILVETEEEAASLRDDAMTGSDFGALAKEHSTGPSGPEGGDLGWFTPDRMVPEFSAAVLQMEIGDISQPVKTDFGWHVINFIEKRALPVPPLEDVRDTLVEELQLAAIEAEIARLQGEATVDISITELDPSVIRDDTLLD